MGRVGITFTLMFLLMLRSMTVFCDPRGLSNIENMIAEFSDAIKNFLDIFLNNFYNTLKRILQNEVFGFLE